MNSYVSAGFDHGITVERHMSMSCDLHYVGRVGIHALLSEVYGLILSEFH